MLSEYKDQIGTAAGILTFIQLLSPLILCKDIVKKGSSAGVDVMPFLGGFVLSSVFVQHALLLGDTVMLNVNIIATALSVAYLGIYYTYTKETSDKVKFYIKLGKAVLFLFVIIGYAQREAGDNVEFRFGLIATFIFFALISAPLLGVRTILRTKDTSSLPMPLILSGTVVTFSWFLYGVATGNTFLQVQNIVAFVIQAFQIGLFVHVKLQKPAKKADKKKKRN